jgi:hypothetical protein
MGPQHETLRRHSLSTGFRGDYSNLDHDLLWITNGFSSSPQLDIVNTLREGREVLYNQLSSVDAIHNKCTGSNVSNSSTGLLVIVRKNENDRRSDRGCFGVGNEIGADQANLTLLRSNVWQKPGWVNRIHHKAIVKA